MGADTKALRSRIKSVDSTLHLTKAMGLVASSKIRHATERMLQSRGYDAALTKMLRMLTESRECQSSPYMRQHDGETRLIVIAGDRGMAGGYNANVFRTVRDYPDAKIVPIGKRACDRYGGPFLSSESLTAAEAYAIAKEQCAAFADGGFRRLGIVSTRYVSIMSQVPQVTWLLPLTVPEDDGEKTASVPIFEPDERTILDRMIPEYVAGRLVAAVRESFASEVAARRMAMDSAGKNAQVMIDDLMLRYNRARQGAITQEITEIVAGAGAE